MRLYTDDIKVYELQEDGLFKGCDVSACRNPMTGEIVSYTVSAVTEPFERPEGLRPATIDEILCKFNVPENPMTFPRDEQEPAENAFLVDGTDACSNLENITEFPDLASEPEPEAAGASIDEMTIAQLKEMCDARGIEYKVKATKAELIAMLEA